MKVPAAMLDTIKSTVNDFGVFTILIAIAVLLFLPRSTVLWVISTLNRCSSRKPKPLLPPKVKHARPIIGHLHMKLDHSTLGSMADNYGPIFTVQLGWTLTVVVSCWEVVKEIFTTHDLAVSGRPSFIVGEYFGYNMAMLGFSPYGPYWSEMRKVSTVHLLSVAKLDSLKHIRKFEVQESIRELYKLWFKEAKGGSGWVKVEMKQWILDLAFNISVRMVTGKRYYGSSGNSDEAQKCQVALRVFFDKLGVFLPADSFPFLRWFDFGGHEKSMKKESEELDTIVQQWLDEHRMERKLMLENGQVKEDQDFMDVLLTIFDETETPQVDGYDSDTINKATCINMIVGGSDTTTVTLTWAISLLLNNPRTLKKAQEELDIHVGRDRQIIESDINNLSYLQAIVKETLRLYPAAPLSGPREFNQDCTVAGYHIPKGTRLTVNLYKLHRDPRVWSNDAFEFRPERFLTDGTHKEVDIRGGQFELIPFGAGRRMCPGANMALTVVHLALAGFLHAFEFTSDAPIDMDEGLGLTVMRANPLNVLLAPRLPSHLYL